MGTTRLTSRNCKDGIKRSKEFGELEATVLAVSADEAEELAHTTRMAGIPFPLLSGPKFDNARRFKAYDDIEEMALHSTILIDKRGRLHWSRLVLSD